MNTLFLLRMEHHFLALQRSAVFGVGTCDPSRVALRYEKGQRWLPLPDGRQACIYDLRQLFTGIRTSFSARKIRYLILDHQATLLAIPMQDRGRLVSADVAAAQPLPPAFPENTREMVAAVLVNGTDLIFLVDHSVLVRNGHPGIQTREQQLEE